MEGLAAFGWWKVALILALFLVLFLIRAVGGGKPEMGPSPRRRRRRPPGPPAS